jgi:predicted component of type VI protein secretion system
MAQLCARPGCSAPAAATFNFDGLNRIVWLNPLADANAYGAGDLCARHAERLRPPRNWELRDCRPTAAEGLPGATAPSRQCAPVAEPPRERVATGRPAPVRVERPAAGPVPHEREDALPRVAASARTPLLARAFRGVGGD